MPPRKLTPDEEDRIVELKLNRVSVRAIAAEMSCSLNTVQDRWNKYLAGMADTRADQLDAIRSEAIARLDQVAFDARMGVVRARQAGDHPSVARYLDVEARAILAAAKLSGADMPVRMEHSGAIEQTGTEPAQRSHLVSVVDQLAARRVA